MNIFVDNKQVIEKIFIYSYINEMMLVELNLMVDTLIEEINKTEIKQSSMF